MKIGIIGTRRRDERFDYNLVHEKYLEVLSEYEPIEIVSGGAYHGGDRFAEKIAREYGHKMTIYFPDWEQGDRAGLERNTLIAEDSDVLIACVSKDRTGGTEDTIRKFVKLKGDKSLHIV